MKTYQHWINGQFVDPTSNEWLDTINPYSGKVWARIPRGNAADADLAVAAAKRAMTEGPWSKISPTERGKIMRRIGDLVAQNAQLLAEIETRDNGKVFAESQGQLKGIPEYWYYYGGLADKIEGSVKPAERSDILAYTVKEPIGVVLALTAWNSPLQFLCLKSAPALAAGCSVVVKPSEFTSATALEFARLTKEAGLPDGVLNVVTGYGQEIGSPLVDHRDVAKITFTGSDTTGARIYEAAARGMKRVALELGGKSPNIVFEDADLNAAAIGAAMGVFGATGQMCIAGSRLLVQNSIKDEFVEHLLSISKGIQLGDPMSASTHIGPISTPPQFQKVLDYIDIAKSEGADLILGGKPATGPALTGDMFVEPTIFTNVTNEMRIAQEEVFGPVLSIIGFDTEEEAVKIGNDVIFGLAAGVWTKDMGRAVRMTRALKAGTVWVNTYRSYSFTVPFGGMKGSGFGRENGIEAIHEFLETKSVIYSVSAAPPANPFAPR